MQRKREVQEKYQPPETPQSDFSYHPSQEVSATGESVKVALRLRPMNNMQQTRGDSNCFKIIDNANCQLLQKNGQILKNFRFNYVFGEHALQAELYKSLKIDQFLQCACHGYSVTIFAYGQTGSGKTYTMAGHQQKFAQQVFQSDESDGIIPRAIKNLWQRPAYLGSVRKENNKKIYNEQIKDLLNPSSGVLHCRWNPANGFFVEDLVIVDCTSVDDLIAVLNQGIRNRKSGSHQLNKDSSRSHSLMTVYVICETQGHDSRTVKRYGKISFVDLAGSQRLKQTKSQGEMAKQTGNINKSLFTLGKVIKALSDQKNKSPYIPYRDSKLTMLLMDSLGGTSKALMVACANPSSVYFEETLSTLNYATRTMNIRNKPVIQMQQKDQIIYGLMRQRDIIRLQNQYLKQQIEKATKGKAIIPSFEAKKKNLPPLNQGNKNASTKPLSLQKPHTPQHQDLSQSIQSRDKSTREQSSLIQPQVSLNKIIQQYSFQMSRLQIQNHELRNARQVAQKNYMIVTNDNNALQIKLDNLQQLFIKSSSNKKNINQEYMNSNLATENRFIRNRISDLQQQIYQLKQDKLSNGSEDYEEKSKRMYNQNLKDRLQFLKQRQLELLKALNKHKK